MIRRPARPHAPGALARRVFRWGCDGVLWVARRRATTASETTATRSCLVLAPHPDDETLGCGALLSQRVRAGARVDVVVATDGRGSFASTTLTPDDLAAVRHDEVCGALRELGVDGGAVSFLGFEDGTLSRHRAELAAQVRAAIEWAGADDLIIPLPVDGHPDHRALALAALQGVRDAGARCRVLGYAVWLAKVDAWTGGRRGPGAAVDVAARLADVLVRLPTEVVVDPGAAHAKRRAVAWHRSQTTNLTGEPGWPSLGAEDLRRFVREDELFFVLDGAVTRSLSRR